MSFFMSPNGKLEVITTYEKIHSQPLVAVACKSPQECLPFEAIEKCCDKIKEALYLRGSFGFFTLDLLAFKEKEEAEFRYYAIGLDTHLNTYTCSYFYFDALMNGKLMLEEGSYLVEEKPPIKEKEYAKSVADQSFDTDITVLNTISTRRYLFAPYVCNPRLNNIELKTFFKFSKIAGIQYDFERKEGTCMLLVDILTSGVLGLLSIYKSEEEINDSMHRALDFIHSQCKQNKTVNFGTNILKPRCDRMPLQDVLSIFSRLKQRKQREQNKINASRQYNLKANFDSLI